MTCCYFIWRRKKNPSSKWWYNKNFYFTLQLKIIWPWLYNAEAWPTGQLLYRVLKIIFLWFFNYSSEQKFLNHLFPINLNTYLNQACNKKNRVLHSLRLIFARHWPVPVCNEFQIKKKSSIILFYFHICWTIHKLAKIKKKEDKIFGFKIIVIGVRYHWLIILMALIWGWKLLI